MYRQYEKAMKVVLDYLVEQGYSTAARDDFRRATGEFRKHLESIRLGYSRAVAQAWLESVRPGLRRRKYLSLCRSLALVDEASRNGSVTITRFCYRRPPPNLVCPTATGTCLMLTSSEGDGRAISAQHCGWRRTRAGGFSAFCGRGT